MIVHTPGSTQCIMHVKEECSIMIVGATLRKSFATLDRL